MCDRELKSKAGLVRHENACRSNSQNKAIILEVMDNEYYEFHPRRLIKLKGLLSRTTIESERVKIIQMIVELRDEHN
tara:strand:- start:35 stop:265 length:231 start_codon:yes stop_codon:yes gene_type:complete